MLSYKKRRDHFSSTYSRNSGAKKNHTTTVKDGTCLKNKNKIIGTPIIKLAMVKRSKKLSKKSSKKLVRKIGKKIGK